MEQQTKTIKEILKSCPLPKEYFPLIDEILSSADINRTILFIDRSKIVGLSITREIFRFLSTLDFPYSDVERSIGGGVLRFGGCRVLVHSSNIDCTRGFEYDCVYIHELVYNMNTEKLPLLLGREKIIAVSVDK